MTGWPLPPCVDGMLTVTIFPLADKGSVAVITLPAIDAGVAATWNVCPEVVTLPTTVATGLVDAGRYTSHTHPLSH